VNFAGRVQRLTKFQRIILAGFLGMTVLSIARTIAGANDLTSSGTVCGSWAVTKSWSKAEHP
jgi:hypothetical protein